MRTTKPKIMGVLNVTPDSFSDGGQYQNHNLALTHSLAMIADGADIIDVGGQSSRPGAKPISLDEELARTIPIIQSIRTNSNISISIDTNKPEVMQAALQAGADFINDISALAEQKSLMLMAKSHCQICLMHMQGTPENMQNNPHYDDVVSEVYNFFKAKIKTCQQAGIDKGRLILDVGFGFGKTFAHNLALLNHLHQFKALDLPILVGLSKKSIIDKMLGGNTKPKDRIIGSTAAALKAAHLGADIIRTHDVKETKEAFNVWYY